ncbi:hypothetical protein BYT27DRAFT_6459425 [Phlegmacium glaucopus]|nr:hypothetical protein BYT27DRAFT_6459425 [Phlegmacium glaucopus]
MLSFRSIAVFVALACTTLSSAAPTPDGAVVPVPRGEPSKSACDYFSDATDSIKPIAIELKALVSVGGRRIVYISL